MSINLLEYMKIYCNIQVIKYRIIKKIFVLKDTEKATPNEDTNEVVDATEEEDPIIEDVSRVDLTNLEVVSR